MITPIVQADSSHTPVNKQPEPLELLTRQMASEQRRPYQALTTPTLVQPLVAEAEQSAPAIQFNQFLVNPQEAPKVESLAPRSGPPATVKPLLPIVLTPKVLKPTMASQAPIASSQELATSAPTESMAMPLKVLPQLEPLSARPEPGGELPEGVAVRPAQAAPAKLTAPSTATAVAPTTPPPYAELLARENAVPVTIDVAEVSNPVTPVIPDPAAISQARAELDRAAVAAPMIRQTDFSTALGNSAYSRQPAAPQPDAADDAIVEFGTLPEGSPFEAIAQSGTINLRVRRSLLMRTKVDIYRTAIVDDGIVELAQFTPREISLIGRSQGQTHVTFWFDDPNMQPVTYLVEVAVDELAEKKDVEKYKLLESVVNEMFPDSKVYLVLVADKLLVKGQARDSEEAAQIMAIIRAQSGSAATAGYGGLTQGAATPVLSLAATGSNPGPAYTIINMLRVPGVQQVALRVKIAELNRSAARGFGVDIVGQVDITDSSKLFFASLLNASSGGGTSLIASVDGDDLDIGIRYAQQRGVIRLLSEPTLVTLSGRPATFIAGGEFAVPTIVGSVGLNAVTTDFRAFGAIISFLPTVIDKDRIRLQVAPEFSQINSDLSVGGTPGLNVRAATTTVEMREGQTLAIAGLLEDTYKGTTVGDLPYLAQVFGRRDTSRNETELIILVTPELVQAMEPEEVPPLPGFDVTEPNACEFFYHGDIEGNPTRDHRSTVWPRLRKRYGMGGPAMTSGPFGHGQ